ncbi:MAG: alpha-2-macroglobulin [Pseudomonadota bacterium]
MALLRTVFGQFSWAPPGWARRIGARRFLIGGAAVLAAAGITTAGLAYYRSLPQPATVFAAVSPPGLTPIVNDRLEPAPLTLEFTVRADPRFPIETVDSVARIDQVGETLAEGISLEPSMEGEWQWVTENRLRFTPAADWPAGQAYVVRYEPSIFAPNLEFDALSAEFETPPFSAAIEALEFYQDPVEHDLRKVVADLAFSHPIDRQSLTEKLEYTMRESGANIRTAPRSVDFEIRYGPHDRTAYVHSVPIDIPPEENYMTLELGAGLSPASGPAETIEALLRNVLIPDVGSYFRVSDIRALIARNEDDDPVQTLMLRFTDRVETTRLQQRISAYLLPENAIFNGTVQRGRRWQSPREVTPDVLARSQAVGIELSPVEGEAASLHSATVRLPEGRSMYVRVESGLTSEGEFTLSRAFDTLVTVPAYPKEARIAQSGAVLPLTGSHQLTFVSRGVATLQVEIGQLLADDVNHLASQTGGDMASPYFSNYRFGQDNISSRVTRYVELNPEAPGKAVYSSLDLSEYLPDGGYYFIKVQGWDKANQRVIGSADRRFVLVTDIGLLVKTNVDSTQDVFVHSIASGRPLAGATVRLLGRNGVPIVSRVSSAEGRASFPAVDGFEREQTPTVFVVNHANDSVFMPYGRHGRMLQYSRFDTGGEYLYLGSDQERLRAQVFSDRGIYRPGDTVNLAAIVKRDDWLPLGNVPLYLRVIDPRGQIAFDRKLRLPDGGLLDEQFATEAASPTGNYSATLYLVGDNERRRSIGNAGFKVEEFQPDRLRIRSRIFNQQNVGQKSVGWLKPDDLSSEVRLENLFGTPAQGRRVAAELQLEPSGIRFAEYTGYVFEDPLRQAGTALQAIKLPLPDATTNADGLATLPLPVDQYEQGIYRLTVAAEGFEQGGGRSVRARASVMLSPLDYLIGHKTSGDLGYVKKGSEHRIDYIGVDSDGARTELGDLTLSVIEYRYVSTLVQRPNGTYAYQSIRKEAPVSSKDFRVAEEGTSFELPTATAGLFAVEIEDADGLVFSKVDFAVAGARNLAGTLERDAELDLRISGKEFEAGDEIELQITAPYTGSGLITIERDRVYAHKWISSDSNTSVHTIRVPDDLEGNAYVNVAFVRALDSPEIYLSPLSYAVAPFSVNKAARSVEIDIEVPELVRPGSKLSIAHTSSKPARIVVYAVDEGILQVANYKMPDPLRHFLPKMALQVVTYQLADLLLPEFAAYARTAAPGGGEAAGLAGSNLNPFRRKTDAPVAFWSGVIDSGPAARSVSFDVPDYFNGRLRVMAVAVAEAAVGQQQASTIVRAPFVVTPNLLTAAAPGDEFEVNVGLSNNLEGSGDDAAIALSVEATEHLEVLGDSTLSLNIGEGNEGRAKFRVRALDKPGAAKLTFLAASGSERSSIDATVSIRPPVAYVSTLEAGVSSDDPVRIGFERELYSEFGQQSAAASASPLVLTDGLLEYLDAFPHACAEQIVSKVFPQIGFLNHNAWPVDEARTRELFAATVSKLRSRQGSEGGFRFWATSQEPANFPSAYIVHFLTDARELGLPVPPDMLDAGLGFLRTLAAAEVRTLPDARLRAYAIYLLTRNAAVTTNYLTELHETLEREHPDDWRADLTAAYMAATYEQLKESRLGNDLVGGYRLRGGNEMYSDFDTRLGRDAQYLYLLARHFPERARNVGSETLQALTEPVMRNRFNTLSSAYTILALGEYTRAVTRADGPNALRIAARDAGVLKTLVESTGLARTEVATGVRDIEISSDSDSDTFYVVSQTGFDREPPGDALAEGLEIYREYLDDNGDAVTQTRIGDELTVRLRVRSTGQPRSNVALVDLLPGGFEILAESVHRQHGGWTADYFDVREDRLVVYGSFGDRLTEYQYRVKATSAGSFVAPSAFAGSMYDRSVQARTKPGRIDVQGLP